MNCNKIHSLAAAIESISQIGQEKVEGLGIREAHMKVDGEAYRTIWLNADGKSVDVIDQTRLPHVFAIKILRDLADAEAAIRLMVVRGAPLIGATAAYGVALAMRADASSDHLAAACAKLAAARPTAVNLRWALERLSTQLERVKQEERAAEAYRLAAELCDEDVRINHAIGVAGAAVIAAAWDAKGRSAPVHILTHCNAGWLATVDRGTALAPIYQAHDDGVPVHVFVDETRPRNQGASLTAWELKSHGVPHSLIVDNAGGHLMQRGEIDLCIVGTDRVTADAAVCNKIGTYLKALAAHDNGVPFYVGLPSPTIDWRTPSGDLVPIEDRGDREVTHMTGKDARGEIVEVLIAPEGTKTRNPGFDVTPSRLVTGFFTERGHIPATAAALKATFGGAS
jgi:methylthioribose-1-phosphate isomerase